MFGDDYESCTECPSLEREIRTLEAHADNLERQLEREIERLESVIERLENEKYDLMDRLNEPCMGCGS